MPNIFNNVYIYVSVYVGRSKVYIPLLDFLKLQTKEMVTFPIWICNVKIFNTDLDQ